MSDEKKGIAEAISDTVENFNVETAEMAEAFGGDGDDGTELGHIANDPEDVEVD